VLSRSGQVVFVAALMLAIAGCDQDVAPALPTGPTIAPPPPATDLVLAPGGALGAMITGADAFRGEDDLVGRCDHLPCRIVWVVSPGDGYIDIRLWWESTSSVLALYVPSGFSQSERYCCEPSHPVTVAVRSGRNAFVVGFERAGALAPPTRTASEYFQIETSEVRATR
jgi:hypothetical protein